MPKSERGKPSSETVFQSILPGFQSSLYSEVISPGLVLTLDRQVLAVSVDALEFDNEGKLTSFNPDVAKLITSETVSSLKKAEVDLAEDRQDVAIDYEEVAKNQEARQPLLFPPVRQQSQQEAIERNINIFSDEIKHLKKLLSSEEPHGISNRPAEKWKERSKIMLRDLGIIAAVSGYHRLGGQFFKITAQPLLTGCPQRHHFETNRNFSFEDALRLLELFAGDEAFPISNLQYQSAVAYNILHNALRPFPVKTAKDLEVEQQ